MITQHNDSRMLLDKLLLELKTVEGKNMKDLMAEASTDDVTDSEANAANKPDAIPNWDSVLGASAVTGDELNSLEIAPRETILANWFCGGDLGFIFGLVSKIYG